MARVISTNDPKESRPSESISVGGRPISLEHCQDQSHITRRTQTRCFKEALARVQHLFVDTPSVKLTTADAARLAGLDRQVCRVLLRTLTTTGFLAQREGIFVRHSSICTTRDHGGSNGQKEW